ncbi:hypothetical protein JTB14_022621 [Gonioctena quinquepunctata]|nr:hypothetical protein JTB14_022621 [Gonioctena quinquepunctata]
MSRHNWETVHGTNQEELNDLIEDPTILLQLGMDSLMSAEISQILNRKFQLDMSITRIENLTFGYLKNISNEPKQKIPHLSG